MLTFLDNGNVLDNNTSAIALIVCVDDSFDTSPYKVFVNGVEAHRANTLVKAQSWVMWHYGQGTLAKKVEIREKEAVLAAGQNMKTDNIKEKFKTELTKLYQTTTPDCLWLSEALCDAAFDVLSRVQISENSDISKTAIIQTVVETLIKYGNSEEVKEVIIKSIEKL